MTESRYGCGVEFALSLLGGKWKTVLLARLKERPHRYGELRALVPAISDKMLTQRLADLMSLGFVMRELEQDVHRYRLAPAADELRPVLESLHAWGLAEAQRRDVRVGVRPQD